MPKTLSHSLFLRMSRSEELTRTLCDLHHISGMNALFTDAQGKPVHAYPRAPLSGFCALLREQGGFPNCRMCGSSGEEFRRDAVKHLRCPGGLKELTHTLAVEEQVIGSLVLSVFRESEQGEAHSRQAWLESARSGGNISWMRWHEAWERAPVLNREQVSAYTRWLKLAADDLMRRLDRDSAFAGKSEALPAAVVKACHYIRDHFSDPISMKEVAEVCELSAEYLSRLFHQTTGLRMQDYLTETRMNHATYLLMGTRYNIASIATQVGYSTISRFNHNFKSYTGMTPSQWRKRESIAASRRGEKVSASIR